MGVGDHPLQEYTSDAEKMRVMQAPNRKEVWSRSQMPREMAMQGPRFEQTIIEVQV
jgi:NADH dehydrogenase (ubiquinone) Fe-S protein 6